MLEVEKIVTDILEGKKDIHIRYQNISRLDKKGIGPIEGIEFLAFYKIDDAQSISGGELFKAAAEMNVVAQLDLKALHRINYCLEKGIADIGMRIPPVDGVKHYHVNLSPELLRTAHKQGFQELLLEVDSIIDECEEKGGGAIFELSERLDHQRDYDCVCDLIRSRDHIHLALDDSYAYAKQDQYFRTPAIFEFEFQDSIEYTKLDFGFFWQIVKFARFPRTLKTLIERHNCGRRDNCPYNHTLIVEGCKDVYTINELFTTLEKIGGLQKGILIQGDIAPVGRIGKKKFLRRRRRLLKNE